MNQQIVVYSHNGTVLSNSNDTCNNMDEHEDIYAEWEAREERVHSV